MNTCIGCEYYNVITGRCDVTGEKKDFDDSCKHYVSSGLEDYDYDEEH